MDITEEQKQIAQDIHNAVDVLNDAISKASDIGVYCQGDFITRTTLGDNHPIILASLDVLYVLKKQKSCLIARS